MDPTPNPAPPSANSNFSSGEELRVAKLACQLRLGGTLSGPGVGSLESETPVNAMRFTLASESARRVSLLRGVGYDFDTKKSGFPEVSFDDPKQTVEVNAKGKALAVSKDTSGIVLGADTVVYSPDGEVLGQAKDEGEVRRMLSSLHGRAHEVHSGVAVARGGEVVVRHSVTRVRMRSLSEEEISAYVFFGEGVGKAGGYAIQGKAALFVEWIGGDYTNVVGLPLALTSRMLEEFGVRWR